jgi:hypothetical protein
LQTYYQLLLLIEFLVAALSANQVYYTTRSLQLKVKLKTEFLKALLTVLDFGSLDIGQDSQKNPSNILSLHIQLDTFED